MKATRQVLDEMRAAADVMSPKSGIRSTLEKWIPRLREALEEDARATESAAQARSPSPRYDESIHGIFDNRKAQERQTWALGRLQTARPRAIVERFSRKPWGSYQDLPGGG